MILQKGLIIFWFPYIGHYFKKVMRNFTKWLGAGLGFTLGGPIGAAIGFTIGSFVDGFSSD